MTEQTFEAETIRRSVKHPVVVELYSPRVATGQQLSDALIEIANENDGKFLLARLNVDTAPGIVQALGLQAVPTVIALIGGQVAPLFQGVLPKDQVQAAIDQLLKAAVANGIVGRADPVGGEPAPTTRRRREPVGRPAVRRRRRGLRARRFRRRRGRVRQAAGGQSGDAEAQAGKAQAGLFARATALDPQAVLAKAAAPDDVRRRSSWPPPMSSWSPVTPRRRSPG